MHSTDILYHRWISTNSVHFKIGFVVCDKLSQYEYPNQDGHGSGSQTWEVEISRGTLVLSRRWVGASKIHDRNVAYLTTSIISKPTTHIQLVVPTRITFPSTVTKDPGLMVLYKNRHLQLG